MAGESKKPPAPIDKPLASSYLKQFHGWSSNYPPGISDPATLRISENMQVTRDGALRIRPALRNVLNQEFSLNTGNGDDLGIVGGFEQFFIDSTATYTGKAFLVAIRGSATIQFRAGLQRKSDSLYDIKTLTDPAVGFVGTIPTFTLATTFIKYLQIDNKILALSDNGDPVIMFNVGTVKTAKSVSPSGLTMPSPSQLLTVLHPDAPWINNATKNTIPAAETPTDNTLIAKQPAVGTVVAGAGTQAVMTVPHGLKVNQPIFFTTTGTLWTGVTANTIYYVKTVLNTLEFEFSATVGGAVIDPTGGSGVHTLNLAPPATQNPYNFAFWYTFYNEFGESSPSLLTMVKTKRGWSAWKFNAPVAATGEPTDPVVADPKLAGDQLVAILPTGLLATARTQGAIGWNLYLATWADDAPVPSEGILVASKAIVTASTDAADSWLQALAAVPAGSVTMPLPNADTRAEFNYSKGPTARQGLVAADRIILVNDAVDPALIRWSSNQPTKYTDFSPSFGGGQKTLSSGNLLIPSAVKLWQNPQSVDTITILCEGVDGYHAAYYMAPASVSGQSESTVIMGFEETTATPGTVSPYGVEVFDNDLYHPLETELMKSSASNYNLSHKTLTDDIANSWLALINKRSIVSAQYDGRLYFVVDNPAGSWNDPVTGEPLDKTKYKGNEIWVMDAMGDKPVWDRWLVPAIALRKLEVAGKLRLGVVTPETVYYFADEVMDDHYFPPTNVLQTRPIPWRFETNTMGANRSHNAFAHLQQAVVSLGNFYGALDYGIRFVDSSNLKPIDIHNRVLRPGDPSDGLWPKDTEDPLLIRKATKEWVFYASSVVANGELQSSFGQFDFVQFRYLSVSVNQGYEMGSVETFEYGRETAIPSALGYGMAPFGSGPYGG
jgi:hypothetical protein